MLALKRSKTRRLSTGFDKTKRYKTFPEDALCVILVMHTEVGETTTSSQNIEHKIHIIGIHLYRGM